MPHKIIFCTMNNEFVRGSKLPVSPNELLSSDMGHAEYVDENLITRNNKPSHSQKCYEFSSTDFSHTEIDRYFFYQILSLTTLLSFLLHSQVEL